MPRHTVSIRTGGIGAYANAGIGGGAGVGAGAVANTTVDSAADVAANATLDAAADAVANAALDAAADADANTATNAAADADANTATNAAANTVTNAAANDAATLVLMAEHGESLLDLMRRSGVDFFAPCGGGGRCGKCLVRVHTDLSADSPPTADELAILTNAMYQNGYRLACFVRVACDMVIELVQNSAATAKILTTGVDIKLAADPFVRKYAVDIKKQTLENQTPEAEHIAAALSIQHSAFAAAQAAAQLAATAAAQVSTRSSAHAAASALPETRYYASAGEIGMSAIVPNMFADLQVLNGLPQTVGAEGGRVTCVCAGDKIIGVEPGDTGARCYGAAFDIGTTTIAGYLYNLSDGQPAAVVSSLNPQAAFGADVISRINYSTSATDGIYIMKRRILDEINRMLSQLSVQVGIRPSEIYAAYIVGNTTMLHFFMGLYAGGIAVSPFIPMTTGMCMMSGRQAGLLMNGSGVAVCLPGVSAYVGADTMAAALACDMDMSDGINLLIDIGTNGEILIGSKEYMYACSAAAGPAFEGASIRYGVGGVDGAIDSVQFSPEGGVAYTTIGKKGAIGICGSGLVDLVAQLLSCKAVDETGRLLDAEEAADEGLPPALCGRLVKMDDGMRAFMLAAGDSPAKPVAAGAAATAAAVATATTAATATATATAMAAGGGALPASPDTAAGGNVPCAVPEGIYITQRDIREIQNAKAAIAAGIVTLLLKSNLKASDVGHIYLAGGFGNYIRVQSALDIGLIFREFKGRILPVGNAAGAGAVSALLSGGATRRMSEMSRKTRYIELSTSPEFTSAYVECMTFE